MPTDLPQDAPMDYERYMQRMVDKLISTDYEFLGLMHAETGHLMVFGQNKDTGGMARNGSFYDTEMPRVFRGLLPQEVYDEAVCAMARPRVIEELAQHGFYSCAFQARSFGSTRAGRKQWRFVYLDAAKTQILMTRIDITDVFTAERDPLSGLYNRQAFYRHTRELLDAHPTQKFVMLRCDVDRFKAYNDAYSTQAGDRLLAEFGRAIRVRRWPDLAIFARIEADHFCALFPADELDVERWSQDHARWLGSITRGYRLTSSIGIYAITDPKIDVSLMCDRALLALRTVKHSYDRKTAWYDDTLRRQLMAEQALVDEMEDALREGQFVLYFQPQINFSDGALVGAEALVRWRHPVRGMIAPGDFIPLFEKNGFILKLDKYVWEQACRYLRSWLDRTDGAMNIPVSVNISRYDLYDPGLCRALHELVQKYDLPTRLLRLEITESAYMENPDQLIGVVKELQRLGFTVEMDDFGAGYSSLNTLKDVPVDVLKLDIRFLSNGADDARGGTILYSVIRMAHWLKLPVIAEGVETDAQAEYLNSLSCFYMQGFRFGKPMPAEEYEVLVLRGQADEMNLATVTSADIDALWDPAGQASVIFNRFVGGAAILEYWNGSVEIIRANDQFYQELNTTRLDYLDKQRNTLDRFDAEHKVVYLSMLEQAVRTGEEAECEVQSLPQQPGQSAFWTHNRVQLLTQVRDRALLYLSVENISARKTLEDQLRRALGAAAQPCAQPQPAINALSNQELRIMEEQSGMMVCRYYMKDRTLERLYKDPARRHGATVLQENVPDDSVAQQIVSPTTAAAYLAFFQQMIDGVPHGSADVEMRMTGGAYRWHHGEYSLVYAADGAPAYALITFFDNTRQREVQLASEKWRASLSLALADALLYAEVNLSRNTVEQLEFQTPPEHPEDRPGTFEAVARCGVTGTLEPAAQREYEAFLDRQRLLGLFAEGVSEDHFDYCMRTADGEDRWLRASVGMAKYPTGDDVMAFLSFTGLTGREQELEILSKKAFEDALTGVLNREGFERRAEELLSVYDPKLCTALFMIDLDNFKQVNDRLGHQAGDLVLRQVAGALRDAFQATDAVGRIGGDEFMVLLTGHFSAPFLEKKAAELLRCTQMQLGSRQQIPVSVSIGIAFGWARFSLETLYRIADTALYGAKRAGKSRYHIINADTSADLAQTGADGDLLSLQTLPDDSDAPPLPRNRTPYQALIENMPGGVVVISLSDRMRLSHCNDWLVRSFGYAMGELEEMQHDDPMILLHPDDRAALGDLLRQMYGGEDSGSVTYRIRAKDGGYRHIFLQASVTERTAGEVIIYGVQADVDHLMRLQTALRDSQQRLEALINAIPGGIAIFELGADLRITHIGSWFREYCGYDNDELSQLRGGTRLNSICPADQPVVQQVLRDIRSGMDVVNVSAHICCKDGSVKPVHIWGAVFDRTPEKVTMYTIYTPPESYRP